MEKHIQMDNLSSNFYPLNWIRIEVNGNANTQLSQGDTDLLGLKLQHKKGSISKEEKTTTTTTTKNVSKMQVLGTCDTYTAPVAVFQSLKTAGHYKTLNVKNTLSALMYINSDIK